MTTSSPHDALFKQHLSNVETARDFLTQNLPAALCERLDFSTLELAPGSFIEPELKACYSDILYSVQMDGNTAYAYCLIEHQSTPDRLLPLRMLRYSLAAMFQHLAQGHEDAPIVIPILYYQGKVSPYPFSNCWLDVFRDPVMARQLYGHDFPLLDLSVVSEVAILQHKRMALLEMMQKHIRDRDIGSALSHLVAVVRLELWSADTVRCTVRYLLRYGKTKDPRALLHALAEAARGYEEVIMNMEQQLIQEGLQQGVQKGRKEGRKEGREEGQREIARNLLSLGVARAHILQATGLSAKELDRLSDGA